MFDLPPIPESIPDDAGDDGLTVARLERADAGAVGRHLYFC